MAKDETKSVIEEALEARNEAVAARDEVQGVLVRLEGILAQVEALRGQVDEMTSVEGTRVGNLVLRILIEHGLVSEDWKEKLQDEKGESVGSSIKVPEIHTQDGNTNRAGDAGVKTARAAKGATK